MLGGVLLQKMKIDSELNRWIKEHVDLLRWLKNADQDMEYGEIIIHYHQGKITSYDICPRERMYLKKNNIVK